jgi:hypothetical protein
MKAGSEAHTWGKNTYGYPLSRYWYRTVRLRAGQLLPYLQEALCSPLGEEEPLLVEVEDGGLQLPGAQIYNSEEVEPGSPIAHFQPLSHTIRSKD